MSCLFVFDVRIEVSETPSEELGSLPQFGKRPHRGLDSEGFAAGVFKGKGEAADLAPERAVRR